MAGPAECRVRPIHVCSAPGLSVWDPLGVDLLGARHKFLRFVSWHCASRIDRLRRSGSRSADKSQLAERMRVPCWETPPLAESRGDFRQVRRVEEFFRERARGAVILAEAAACAGCSVRALQLAFRRYRGMTPMMVLRPIRLEAARDALA